MSCFNLRRFQALLHKEYLQILRDKSVLWAAFFLPLLLFLIYGYGLNLDIKPVRVCTVSPQQTDPLYQETVQALSGTPYLEHLQAFSLPAGQSLLKAERCDVLLLVPTAAEYLHGRGFYAAVNGSAALQGQLSRAYVEGALSLSLQKSAGSAVPAGLTLPESFRGPPLSLNTRAWFNPDNQSVFYLLPGQFIGILTLVCNVLSSLMIARECGRGTLTSLFARKVTAAELLLAKLLPPLFLSLLAAAMLLIASELLFHLPVRGSIPLLGITIFIYALSCCLMGLWLSALVRDQFLACEYAIILSFLPAILLSGAIFDLRTLPWGIALLGQILPPTYAVQSAKICFLSGGSEVILWRNLGLLTLYALFFALLCARAIGRLQRGK